MMTTAAIRDQLAVLVRLLRLHGREEEAPTVEAVLALANAGPDVEFRSAIRGFRLWNALVRAKRPGPEGRALELQNTLRRATGEPQRGPGPSVAARAEITAAVRALAAAVEHAGLASSPARAVAALVADDIAPADTAVAADALGGREYREDLLPSMIGDPPDPDPVAAAVVEAIRRAEAAHGPLFETISAVLFEADLYALNYESNTDEYDGEAAFVLAALPECRSASDVRRAVDEAIARAFGWPMPEAEADHEAAARAIWALWQRWQRAPWWEEAE